MNEELEFYKLLTETNSGKRKYVQEMGWVSDSEFCVWISYGTIEQFIIELKRIFDYTVFGENGFNAIMQHDCICIELCAACGEFIDLETVFPKEKYTH